MRKLKSVQAVAVMLGALTLLIGGLAAGAEAAPARNAAVHTTAVKAQFAAACTATNCPSWDSWKCQTGSNGGFKYYCYTWVRYDYCGGSRSNTVNQYTKMAGQFRILRGTPPGAGAWAIYPWSSRGDNGAVTRSYSWGMRSATVAVWTTVKPDNKPYISCTL